MTKGLDFENGIVTDENVLVWISKGDLFQDKLMRALGLVRNGSYILSEVREAIIKWS